VDLLEHLVDVRRPVQLCDAGREVSTTLNQIFPVYAGGWSSTGGWISSFWAHARVRRCLIHSRAILRKGLVSAYGGSSQKLKDRTEGFTWQGEHSRLQPKAALPRGGLAVLALVEVAGLRMHLHVLARHLLCAAFVRARNQLERAGRPVLGELAELAAPVAARRVLSYEEVADHGLEWADSLQLVFVRLLFADRTGRLGGRCFLQDPDVASCVGFRV